MDACELPQISIVQSQHFQQTQHTKSNSSFLSRFEYHFRRRGGQRGGINQKLSITAKKKAR